MFIYIISYLPHRILSERHVALNEHLRPIRRRKRLEDMQTVRSSSQRIGQKVMCYVCMGMCVRSVKTAYHADACGFKRHVALNGHLLRPPYEKAQASEIYASGPFVQSAN